MNEYQINSLSTPLHAVAWRGPAGGQSSLNSENFPKKTGMIDAPKDWGTYSDKKLSDGHTIEG